MNTRSPIKKFAKAAKSLVLLLVFALPFVMSVLWGYGIIAGNRDGRKVFGQQEIATFADTSCAAPDESTIQPFDEPLISVTFDDGWESIYSKGFGVLEACGIKTTQYILGDHFDEPLYLSEAQVRSMQAAGHEIASHSMTHPDLTHKTATELDWELGQADRLLTDKFGETRDFATPLGASNDLVLQHIRQYYRSHRNTASDPVSLEEVDINVATTFNPYNINAYTVRNTTTLKDLEKLIDYTVRHKGWLVITYHQVDYSNAAYAVTPEVLDDQLRLIRSKQIKSAPLGKVLDALEARQHGRN